MAQMKDKVAIITGGGSGMGRATSLLFAQEGAAIAVADLNDDGGQETVAMIEASILNLVSQTADTFGRIDSMLTAAGISYSNFMEQDESTDPWKHPEACPKPEW